MSLSLSPTLHRYIESCVQHFSSISADRKHLLSDLANYVRSRKTSGLPVRLIFICTHNSRRSHLSHIWAQTAAAFFGVDDVHCFSGGTEATAFNPRAVHALQEAGFLITEESGGSNPVYRVIFSSDAPAIRAFSKAYSHAPNPTTDFCAVMTCSHADEHCPLIPGVDKRIALTYDDPKDFDGTSLESAKYAERTRQIGTELLYAFSLV